MRKALRFIRVISEDSFPAFAPNAHPGWLETDEMAVMEAETGICQSSDVRNVIL